MRGGEGEEGERERREGGREGGRAGGWAGGREGGSSYTSTIYLVISYTILVAPRSRA